MYRRCEIPSSVVAPFCSSDIDLATSQQVEIHIEPIFLPKELHRFFLGTSRHKPKGRAKRAFEDPPRRRENLTGFPSCQSCRRHLLPGKMDVAELYPNTRNSRTSQLIDHNHVHCLAVP